jgi:hypothetical protein
MPGRSGVSGSRLGQVFLDEVDQYFMFTCGDGARDVSAHLAGPIVDRIAVEVSDGTADSVNDDLDGRRFQGTGAGEDGGYQFAGGHQRRHDRDRGEVHALHPALHQLFGDPAEVVVSVAPPAHADQGAPCHGLVDTRLDALSVQDRFLALLGVPGSVLKRVVDEPDDGHALEEHRQTERRGGDAAAEGNRAVDRVAEDFILAVLDDAGSFFALEADMREVPLELGQGTAVDLDVRFGDGRKVGLQLALHAESELPHHYPAGLVGEALQVRLIRILSHFRPAFL